jgi:hypothetical protein
VREQIVATIKPLELALVYGIHKSRQHRGITCGTHVEKTMTLSFSYDDAIIFL